MRKKILLISIFFILLFISTNNTFAFKEIGNYGVDVDYVLNRDTYYNVRTNDDSLEEEVVITDSGRMNQHYDYIDLKKYYGEKYDILNLKSQGYKTLAFEFKIDIREIDDGYQYIFIYKDTTSVSYITGCQLDYWGNKKYTTFSTFNLYTEISLDDLSSSDFIIRYGASGRLDDKWANKYLKVQAGFSKESKKTEYFWELKWISNDTYQYSNLSIAK